LLVNVAMLPSGNYVIRAVTADGKEEAIATFIKN
jgi:hypothetical protein